MAQYDGSIRINTKIDSKEASAQLMTLENRIAKTADKIASLRSKMDELKKTKVPTQEYAELDKELGRLGAAYDKLAERQQRFLSTGGKEGSSAYKRMEYDLDALDVKQDEVIAKMKQLESSGKAFTLGSETEKFANLGQQLKYAENDLAALNQKRSEIVGGNENLKQSYVSLSESIKNAFSIMANRIKHPFQTMKSIASSAIGATSKLLSGMVSVAKKSGSAISGIASTLKKATSAIFGLGNGAKKSGSMLSAFASRLKGIALSLLIFNWITKAFNAMVSGMKTGFSNFAGYSAEFANSVQSMKNAMSTLGNQAAAAFAPLVQAAIPMLVSLINTLTRATTAVAQFIAAITGKSTFKKATKVQEDYAGALGKTAGAAKNANKQLSSLDKLNNLTTNDGGGGGGGGGGGANYGDMFEDADVSSQIKDFADLIKKSWEAADFTEVGAIIGKKLKEGLESIPWEEMQTTAEKVGKSLGTLINGFVEVGGLGYTIGKSIGEAINAGIEAVASFAKNLHWDSIGKFIADGINGALSSIDWNTALTAAVALGSGLARMLNNALTPEVFENIGCTIGMGLNTALAFALSFVSTFDWISFGTNIGNGIKTAIQTINWSLLGELIGGAVQGIIDTFAGFVETKPWDGIGSKIAIAINHAISKINLAEFAASASVFVIGILGEISAAIAGTDWSKVASDVVAAIKAIDWMGIASGLFDIGKELIGAILDAFKKLPTPVQIAAAAIGGFIAAFTTASAITKFIGIVQSVISIVGAVVSVLGGPLTIAIGAVIAIGALLIANWDSIKDAAGKLGAKIKEKWEEIKLATSTTWSAIKGVLTTTWNGIKSVASPIFNAVKTIVTTVWKAIKTVTSTVWNAIKTVVTTVFNVIKDKAGISKIIKDKVVSAWNSIKDKTVSIWNGIKNAIKTPINAIIGFINSFISGVASGINGLIDMLNKFKVDIPEGVPLVGGKTLGFDLSKITAPKIPALATGTVVPPNREFMALLGDNKREPEVVSPLSTMKQANKEAIMEVLSELGLNSRNGRNGGNETFVFQVDGKTFFEIMRKEAQAHFSRTGSPAFPI